MADESKVLIGLGAPQTPADPPTVVIGMTPASFEKLAGGETHTIDLTPVGIRVQILIFRGETHAEMTEVMQQGSAAGGADFVDARGTGKLPDLGIKPPRRH